MASQIVREFGHLVLAIVKAGPSIHTERLTLPRRREYHMLYKKSRVLLLSAGPLKEALAYEQPVYKTCEINSTALTPFAKTMLDLYSFLYREGASEELGLAQ